VVGVQRRHQLAKRRHRARRTTRVPNLVLDLAVSGGVDGMTMEQIDVVRVEQGSTPTMEDVDGVTMEQIDVVKARLARLRSQDEEKLEETRRAYEPYKSLDPSTSSADRVEVMERVKAARDAVMETTMAACTAVLEKAAEKSMALTAVECEQAKAEVEELKRRALDVCASMQVTAAEHDPMVQRVRAERQAVVGDITSAESELNALVNAPVSGGRDPFEWLPDELVLMIMLMLQGKVLWGGVCEHVCQRWARLMRSAPVHRRKREVRWAAYEKFVITPRVVEGLGQRGAYSSVGALAVGLDGKVYSFSHNRDNVIRVWSAGEYKEHAIPKGHAGNACALAVGLDGKIYSGATDCRIKIWSGEDGAHIKTLKGHTSSVIALAVGLDGKVYSGSNDTTIRVWSGDDGTHLQTLEGHGGAVRALAVGLNGKIYSVWDYENIRVWCATFGTHLQTLEGHEGTINALAVGLDGKLYSASNDKTIRVWSGEDGAHLQTLKGHDEIVTALAVGLNGEVYSASYLDGICVWRGSDGALLYDLHGETDTVDSLVVTPDGALITGGGFYDCDDDDYVAMMEVW
jgi:hypothetical protein